MITDDAIAMLSGDWPPPGVEHWPPRDKSRWRPGMHLAGRIEAVLTLPRPDGSKHRGEPYLALYVRRERPQRDGKLVMWHGWHTAAEDVPPMQPAPGLLFTAVYRGQGANDFEDFKYLVTPYDGDPLAAAAAVADGDRAERRQPVTREAQAEATATRNGRNHPPANLMQALPAERPAPGTAAKVAEREAGVPTEAAIAAVHDRADGQRVVLGASAEFREALGDLGPLWRSNKAAEWRRRLTTARQAMLQEA